MTNPVIDFEGLLRRGDEDDEPRFNANGYRREPNLILKEVDAFAVVRPLTESKDWFQARMHRFVQVTKLKPEGQEGGWPESMSATCRKDPQLKVLYPNGCPICTSPLETKFGKNMDEAATDLRFTLAIEREQVTGDGSPEMGGPANLGVKGWADKLVEVPIFDSEGKATKETVKRPSVVILSGTMYQMFQSLRGMGEAYGTIRDRDFRVKRIKNPNGKGDSYQWIGLDKIDSILPGTEHWAYYEDAVKNWVPGGLSVARVVGEKSADSHYERFWTTDGVFQKPGQTRSASGAPASTFTPSSSVVAAEEPDADKLAAMRARIMGNSPASAES